MKFKPNSEENLGWAHIKYEKPEEARRAVEEAQGKLIEGKKIKMDYAKMPKQSQNAPNTVRRIQEDQEQENANEDYSNAYRLGTGIRDDITLDVNFPGGKRAEGVLDTGCVPMGAIPESMVTKLGIGKFRIPEKTPIILANNHAFTANSVLVCDIEVAGESLSVKFIICPNGTTDDFLIGLPLMKRLNLTEELEQKVNELNKETRQGTKNV